MKKQLQHIGLSESEQAVYLTLLKSGHSMTELADAAGAPRTSLYTTIRSLKEKGMVVEGRVNKRRVYRAESPEKLLELITAKEQEWSAARSGIESILPQLQEIGTLEVSVPTVQVYDNVAASMHLRERFFAEMRKHRVGYQLVDSEKMAAMASPPFFNKLTQRRRQITGSKMHIIATRNPLDLKHAAWQEDDFREFRFLPEGTELDSTVVIVGNTVWILTLTEPFRAIEINGDTIAHAVQMMCDALWEGLPVQDSETLSEQL